MAAPRLSPRVEHRVLRAACGLSPPLRRALFGSPPRLDGQELAPDIHVLLQLARVQGEASLVEGRTPERARAEHREEVPIVTGPRRQMREVAALTVPGPAGELPARLYVPPNAGDGPGPLVVYFHGGGWVVGDLVTHDGVCRFLAGETGFRVLSVEYRLAPEHPFPEPFEDAVAAFEWAAGNAAVLGADPVRIAVAGDSAGANLSAAVSLHLRNHPGPRPALQLLLYPVTDAVGDLPSRERFAEGFLLTKGDMDWFEERYIPDGCDPTDPRISMLGAADLSDLPPAYVATAGFDPLRDEGEAYAERMREAGNRVALRRYTGLIHGFAHFTAVSRTSRAAMLEVAGALRMGLA